MAGSIDIRVQRANLNDARAVSVPPPPIGPGEALLQLDRYALTANNVTYAVFGEPFGYWKFFPAAGCRSGALRTWWKARPKA
jgi:hypothetical protein